MNTIEIYRTDDKKQPFRWRLRASNGRILCNGGEAFSRRKRMQKSIEAALNLFPINGDTATQQLPEAYHVRYMES